jgi:dUTP pyrophosphatase
MSESTVRIRALHPKFDERALMPKRMSNGAAGFDLSAALDAAVVLAPGERKLIPCGFAMAIPAGLEGQVRPRSGLALKFGVTLLNSPGTIDSDYRGEVKVLLVNHGHESFTVQPGERVGQLVFARYEAPSLRLVADLDATERGEGGFGSTGTA